MIKFKSTSGQIRNGGWHPDRKA